MGERCANPVIGTDGRFAPRWGPMPFCARDVQVIVSGIGDLPSLYVELFIALPKRSGSGLEPKVSGTRDQPTPLHLHVEALMRQIHQALTSWHESVRYVDTQGRKRAGVEINEAVTALTTDVGALMVLGPVPVVRGKRIVEMTGVDGCLELMRLRARARRLLHLEAVLETREAPCPQCNAYGLVRESGQGYSTCETCGYRLDEDAYQEWCGQLLSAP